MRLQLFVLAYNLGNLLRRLGLPKAIKDWSLRILQVKLLAPGSWLAHTGSQMKKIGEVLLFRVESHFWVAKGYLGNSEQA